MLAAGASALSVDQGGESPIHAAAARREPQVLAVLLDTVGGAAGLRATRPELWRGALHEAAWRGSIEALRLLLPPTSSAVQPALTKEGQPARSTVHGSDALEADLTPELTQATAEISEAEIAEEVAISRAEIADLASELSRAAAVALERGPRGRDAARHLERYLLRYLEARGACRPAAESAAESAAGSEASSAAGPAADAGESSTH